MGFSTCLMGSPYAS
uniref:Uncharacterized protein n=1 Tax=Arundo donax TaxID=35708 RepID=A0A0A9B264_ARUDO